MRYITPYNTPHPTKISLIPTTISPVTRVAMRG